MKTKQKHGKVINGLTVAAALKGRIGSWRLHRCAVLTFLCMSGSFIAGAGSVQASDASYATCAACHGADGQGVEAQNGPALAGQNKDYLIRQMTHFKSGVRGNEDAIAKLMVPMAALLADDQAIEKMASYLSALPPTKPTADSSELSEDLKTGNDYYQGKCGACHGGKAEGNASLQSPRLAGLTSDYLKRQYQNFASGARGSHAEDRYGKQMKFMSNSLPDEKTLNAVIAFITKQP